MRINNKFFIKTLTAFIVIFLMISSSSGSNTQATIENTSNDAPIEFTVPNDSNKLNFSSEVGRTFTIKIKGNPTTGYGWFLDNAKDIDRKVLDPLNLNEHNSADYQTDPHPPGMVGVGGSYYFRFEGKAKADNVPLRFINKRPWEETVDRTVDVSLKLI